MLSIASLGNSDIKTYNYVPTLTASTVNRILIPFSDIFYVADAAIFPIQLKGITYYFTGVKTSTTYRLEIPKMLAVYNAIPGDGAGIEDVFTEVASQSLKLSPNPVNAGDVVNVNVEETASYAVYTINGALIAQGNGNEISTEGLTQGIYIVKITSEKGALAARMIVK